MRRSGRRLKYLLMAAVLILLLVVIIRLVLPEKEDPQASQVYIDTGTGMAWMTPYENVPVNNLTADFQRLLGSGQCHSWGRAGQHAARNAQK